MNPKSSARTSKQDINESNKISETPKAPLSYEHKVSPKLRNLTTFVKSHNIQRDMILIDATDAVVGRLAAFIAYRLRAKHKVNCSPHVDHGDVVIVINTDSMKFTGAKELDKKYYRHTGYPGIKTTNPKLMRAKNKSNEILALAVKGMLAKGPLAYKRLKNLKIYRDASHPHAAQMPTLIDLGSFNKKNIIR